MHVGQSAPMMSPYLTDIREFVERFGFSKERRAIMRGLLGFRGALREVGLDEGFQWLDGSFVEDIESSTRQRAPGDIDVVTFVRRPAACRVEADWKRFNQENFSLLHDVAAVKERFRCDAYTVDLDIEAESLVDSTRYWFGLFSHQRATCQWKGILRIPLAAHADESALEWLNEMNDQDEEY